MVAGGWPAGQWEEGDTVDQPMAVRRDGTWGVLCHLSAGAGLLGLGFGHIVGPLVTWLITRDTSPFADDQGKESLNFQLSMTLYFLICAVSIVGLVLLPAIVIADIVLVIVAAIRASDGECYRYPWTIRFLT